jgi:hypothetical protein
VPAALIQFLARRSARHGRFSRIMLAAARPVASI